MTSAERRRAMVARIIGTGHISTQEELLEELRRARLHATQATLSRDLAKLGARRVSRPNGGTVYELAETLPEKEALQRLLTDIRSNGSLVVIRTLPGGANAVARAIDMAHLPEVLGTIAGDDTIFVAPAQERGLRALATRLAELLGSVPSPEHNPPNPE